MARGHRVIFLSPHNRTIINRWPPHVRDRHAGKITISGWRAGLGERFSFRPADMFRTPFDREAYDVVLLANICHLFAAAANTQLLARLAPALRPGGRLVIVDVLPEPVRADHRYSALLALYEFGLSMRTTAGRVHPLDDYDRWARAAGLSGVRVERLGVDPPLSLLIATPTNPRPRATGPMALR